MPFQSRGFQLAQSVTDLLSAQDWGEPYNTWIASVTGDVYAVKQIPILARKERGKLGRLRFYCCPRDLTSVKVDRCQTTWENRIVIAIAGACQTQDSSDTTQPVGLDELDQYQYLTQSVATFLDENRRSIDGYSMINNVAVDLVDDLVLRETQIYLGVIGIEYR